MLLDECEAIQIGIFFKQRNLSETCSESTPIYLGPANLFYFVQFPEFVANKVYGSHSIYLLPLLVCLKLLCRAAAPPCSGRARV